MGKMGGWRIGTPLSQSRAMYAMGGEGGGGGSHVGKRISHGAMTRVQTVPGDPADGTGGQPSDHPLLSLDLPTVRDAFKQINSQLPTYRGAAAVDIAKLFITVAARSPWSVNPKLMNDEAYVQAWQDPKGGVPPRAAYYFKLVVGGNEGGTIKGIDPKSMISVATFLGERCDEIYNADAFFNIFSACICALEPKEHPHMFSAMLEAMVRFPKLHTVDKFPDALREPLRNLPKKPVDTFDTILAHSMKVIAEMTHVRGAPVAEALQLLAGVARLHSMPAIPEDEGVLL